MIKPKKAIALSPLSHVCLTIILAFTLIYSTSFWTDAIIKIIEMRFPYKAALFVLISTACLLFHKYKTSYMWSFGSIGVVTGLISGYLALEFSSFFIKNAIERTIRSIELFGLLNTLTVEFVFSLILGGWLIGGILFLSIWSICHLLTSAK